MAVRGPRAERLDDEETNAALARYQQTGDVSFRNQVVEAHVPLARHICRDYLDRGVEFDDLVQVATVGLIKAAERFDPDVGVPYRNYASRVINGEIKRWFRDKGWSIRPPRSLIELGTRLNGVRSRLSQELQRAPTIDELAEAMDTDPEDVLAAMEAKAAYRPESLAAPSPTDDRPRDIGVTDDDLRQAEMRSAVESLLSTLDEESRQIVHLRFWEDKTQSEIAEVIGVSQMQVSRLLRRILRQLRSVDELEGGV